MARSLILNPFTSDATISSLLKTLTTLLLQFSTSDSDSHHSLSLFSTLSVRCPHFSLQIFDAVNSSLSAITTSTAALASRLSLLLFIAERDQTLFPALADVTETLFLSLSFRPSISVRCWLLRNAERLRVRPSLLLTIFLGFTKDPYPYVRKAALDGLVGLRKCIIVVDRSVVEACYFQAVKLLFDLDDAVRCSAVSAVSEWGQLLVLSSEETSKREWSDAVFIQLSQMVRDLSVDVRVKAFYALGTVGMVSEDILLQTLSKKALDVTKEKKYPGQFTASIFELPSSSSTRAFIHGLEDEFHEVRRSACHSLCILSDNSALFAGEALNFLMDMLNDDSTTVRLQALTTIHKMALLYQLKVQEAHMHMFIGTIVDNDAMVRCSARKILQVTKLQNICMLKLSVDGLIKNLKMYPQDEADVFSVLFHIGHSHGNFASSFIAECYDEIELAFEGESHMDSDRIAGLLVLAISAPLSQEQQICTIPPMIFSYAVTLLGRISLALAGVMDDNTLLAYLSHCSRSKIVSASEFIKGKDLVVPGLGECDLLDDLCVSTPSNDGMHLLLASDEPSGIYSARTCGQKQEASPHADYQLTELGVTESLKLIFAKVKDVWPLIQFGCIGEVLSLLRNWKKEMATFTRNSKSDSGLVFTMQYLRVVKRLAKAWIFIMSPKKLWSCKIGEMGILLKKLDKHLSEMLYKFRGFSKEEELHVLELILVGCAMRLSDIASCYLQYTLKKLYSIIARMEFLQKEGSIRPSVFMLELKNMRGIDNCFNVDASTLFLFRKSLECFSLRRFEYAGGLKYLVAELMVQGSDSEKAFPFVSGLPVGIPFDITLYNITSEIRLWLRMNVAEFTQFVHVGTKQIEGCNEIRKFPFVAPFYRTPKTNSFTLRVSLGMEYFSEASYLFKRGCVGPRNELVYLCREQEVYFSKVIK